MQASGTANRKALVACSVADWRHGVVGGLLAAVVVLSAILFAAGLDAAQVLVVVSLVLVPVAATVAAFLLVWRHVWDLDAEGRKRQR